LEVIKVIGVGSFAQVKLAKWKPQLTPVAVKVMRKVHVLKMKQVEHVFAEKRILSLIDSPFIVSFFGSFQNPFSLYCVMEYVPGGELFRLLCERDTLSRSEAAFYTAELTMALCSLHAIRCAYRDLKPENILISASGHVKVADFGLSKLLARGEKTYTTCGTHEYIPPEVIDGTGYDETCDWWQLGILLYEMIAAETPFASLNPYALYTNILTKKVEFTDAFDDITKDFITKLLHKDPSKRIHQSDILKHAFFADMSWEKVRALGLQPPFVPALSGEMDSSYFESFGEENGEEGTLEPALQAAFEGY
jgi:serine/threonine protein kinase